MPVRSQSPVCPVCRQEKALSMKVELEKLSKEKYAAAQVIELHSFRSP